MGNDIYLFAPKHSIYYVFFFSKNSNKKHFNGHFGLNFYVSYKIFFGQNFYFHIMGGGVNFAFSLIDVSSRLGNKKHDKTWNCHSVGNIIPINMFGAWKDIDFIQSSKSFACLFSITLKLLIKLTNIFLKNKIL